MGTASKKVQPRAKKKPGRKPTGKDPPMGLRVPVEIRVRIEKLARQKGVTLSKAILSVLDKHLPKIDGES